jgi:hypothetical protein
LLATRLRRRRKPDLREWQRYLDGPAVIHIGVIVQCACDYHR